MPFLSPNQQCQSTEVRTTTILLLSLLGFFFTWRVFPGDFCQLGLAKGTAGARFYKSHFFLITQWKKCSEETQTLRAGCSKTEPKNFVPPQTPFQGARGGQNLISWRWSLPLPTNPVWWRSMHGISSYHGNRPTRPQTHKWTGPITIHCAAASMQCSQQCLSSEGPQLFPHYNGVEFLKKIFPWQWNSGSFLKNRSPSESDKSNGLYVFYDNVVWWLRTNCASQSQKWHLIGKKWKWCWFGRR